MSTIRMSTVDKFLLEHDNILKFRGKPLTVAQLAVLEGVGEKTMRRRINEDMEQLEKLGYKKGRFPLPAIVVHFYTRNWLDNVNINELLK